MIFSPIDPAGISYVDTLYTKAYLHHVFKGKKNWWLWKLLLFTIWHSIYILWEKREITFLQTTMKIGNRKSYQL